MATATCGVQAQQIDIPKGQGYIGTYGADAPFNKYLGTLQPGDPIQFSAGGKTYAGTYIGRKTLDGVEQHVAINVVEIPSSGMGAAGGPTAGTGNAGKGQQPGVGAAGGNAGAGPGTGANAANAAAAAAAGQVVYRLFFVSPELEQRIAQAQRQLDTARAGTQAAIASYRLAVEKSYTQASTSLAEVGKALANAPVVVPSQLLQTFEEQPVRFETSDPALNGHLSRTFYQLTTARVVSPVHRETRTAGVAALAEADNLGRSGEIDAARQYAATAAKYASFLRGTADLLVGIDPISGLARDTYELFSGANLITGEALTDVERALRGVSAGANLATLGAVPVVFGGVNVIRKIAERVRADKLSKIFAVVDNLPFTKHAMEQFTARRLELLINSKTETRLTPDWIKRTIADGKSFWDYKHKTVAFFSEGESGKWLHVAVAKNGQPRIATVIVKDDKFVQNSLWNGRPRFIPYDKPLPNLLIK